ncbi:MAG: hypothetical protein K2K36_01435 [Muribaculaceae bacterium]|nr:hypothetical protein [Muribaculaceae bacterium]
MVEFVAKWGKTEFMTTFADKTASSMQYISSHRHMPDAMRQNLNSDAWRYRFSTADRYPLSG